MSDFDDETDDAGESGIRDALTRRKRTEGAGRASPSTRPLQYAEIPRRQPRRKRRRSTRCYGPAGSSIILVPTTAGRTSRR
jgi:hypothetical protein